MNQNNRMLSLPIILLSLLMKTAGWPSSPRSRPDAPVEQANRSLVPPPLRRQLLRRDENPVSRDPYSSSVSKGVLG
ncbi:hypothetical protein CONLIGDRAFT_514739 [Coniochaeta ligniaria NRRL 30616]|uniref:Secreted protein n=1 Tax=Coniochaeta ligniaria NRRL 30616 TaxID=1408157 RepID=A0A1J7J9W6_9PEZI|nr:hypothetical protein CONLIGDRAFT_514739 [Coniochaeta ligniaria NRRL 30616]